MVPPRPPVTSLDTDGREELQSPDRVGGNVRQSWVCREDLLAFHKATATCWEETPRLGQLL